MSNQSNDYFRCRGCNNIVAYSMMQKHCESNHVEGIADVRPRPTVENPPPPPTFHGRVIPPSRPEPETQGGVFDQTFQKTTNVILMYRSFPRAFKLWTILVFGLAAWIVSSLYTLIVFHI